LLDWIGWGATAIFSISYFCRNATRMRLVQALAALLWIIYGILLKAPPVIFANSIVAAVATYSAWRQLRSQAQTPQETVKDLPPTN